MKLLNLWWDLNGLRRRKRATADIILETNKNSNFPQNPGLAFTPPLRKSKSFNFRTTRLYLQGHVAEEGRKLYIGIAPYLIKSQNFWDARAGLSPWRREKLQLLVIVRRRTKSENSDRLPFRTTCLGMRYWRRERPIPDIGHGENKGQ